MELIRSSGRSIAEVARSLGINDGTLGNWVKADREARGRQADPKGLSESERKELRRLRRQVAELEMDREILRKAARVSRAGDDPVSRFRFVWEHQAEYPVERLCELAGSRVQALHWRGRPRSPRGVAHAVLVGQIREIHEASRGTYGRIRIMGQLRRSSVVVNRKRVARLMRLNRINGVGGPRTARRAGGHRRRI